jgi:hypothetical protein
MVCNLLRVPQARRSTETLQHSPNLWHHEKRCLGLRYTWPGGPLMPYPLPNRVPSKTPGQVFVLGLHIVGRAGPGLKLLWVQTCPVVLGRCTLHF